jgi:cytidylate kinase
MPVITISPEYGSYGDAVAELLCDRLGYRSFDKTLMRSLAAQLGLKPETVIDLSEDRYRPRTLVERLFANAAPRTGNVMMWAEYSAAIDREHRAAELLTQLIHAAYEKSNVVVLGHGGQVVLHEKPGVLHVRLVAPLGMRIRRHQIRAGVTAEVAREQVLERDRSSADFVKRYFGVDAADPTLYDLIINTGKVPLKVAADLIIALLAGLPAGA